MTRLEWKVKIASWGSILHVLLLRDDINGGALATKYGHELLAQVWPLMMTPRRSKSGLKFQPLIPIPHTGILGLDEK